MDKHSKLIALIFQEQQQDALMASGDITGSVVRVTNTGPDQALAVLEAVEKKAKEAGVKLEDAVVLFRTQDNKLKIKQTRDMTAGKGAKWGSFWGLLAGLILGGPIAGALWGLGIGAIYGGKVDHGIDDKFLKSVGKAIDLKTSAVLVLIRQEDYDGAIAYLKTFDAEVYEADISDETEEAVLKAAEDEHISKAVQAEFGDE